MTTIRTDIPDHIFGMRVVTSKYVPRATRPEISYTRPLWRRLISGRTTDIVEVDDGPMILMYGGGAVMDPSTWAALQGFSVGPPIGDETP